MKEEKVIFIPIGRLRMGHWFSTAVILDRTHPMCDLSLSEIKIAFAFIILLTYSAR